MREIDRTSHNWLVHRINNRLLTESLDIMKGRVVDLGCGTAPYKTDILQVADEYVGVDWENSHHDQSHVDIFASLVEPLPIDDAYADVVTAFQVMEHLPEPSFFLSECHRILKPAGRLLITVPFMWHVHEAPYDYFRYTRFGLEYLLKKNGFSEIRIEETTGYWQTAVLKWNYHSRKFARGPLKLLWMPLWWLGQQLAPALDRFVKHPEETASYKVVATRG